MPAPAADKATQQLMAKIAKANQAIDEALSCFKDEKDKVEDVKAVKALRAKIDAAAKLAGPDAVKALTPLLKTAEALAPQIMQHTYDAFCERRRAELKGLVNGALAGVLLDIGKLSDPVLTKLVFAEQAKLRARMDKAEKMKNDLDAVSEMDDLDEAMPALQQRVKAALAVNAWLGSSFKSMLALAASAIASVPSERCRKVLSAELDFVEQAKNDALPRLETKAIESATAPMLRRLQKVATRLSADGSSLDRELIRVGKLVKDAGAPAELAAKLKKLATEKASGWPQVRAFEDFEKALDGFEKNLAALAAQAQKAQVANAN